ncbi:hypothetical protein M493_14330 [Geobacillus genomosp. 3]|uniref:SCP2 domain-containing protein n=1 Tax=Geobacillus genomosp. 3 TaxID=1921421 RepID=S5ZFH2_GEOG3|nr:hypothetical protein [Geobacillus genomosp. 3]AGT33105.1 hypothetical protein M493_14330 [Geobacillus genomosp. 3]
MNDSVGADGAIAVDEAPGSRRPPAEWKNERKKRRIDMPVFQSEQELYDVLGRFFERVAETEESKELIASTELGPGYDAFVQYVFHKPEAKITWTAENGALKIVCGETGLRPELVFEQTADVGHKFWLGKLDLQQALARQQIKVQGPLVNALKVLPQLDAIYPAYREYLQEIGRDDLLQR